MESPQSTHMKPTSSPLFVAAALIGALGTTHAATIAIGSVNDLGSDFFINTATVGGGDFNSGTATAQFRRDFGALEVDPTGGSMVTISGMAWASPPATATTATSITVSISYLGLDGLVGGDDDVFFGTSSATFNHDKTTAGVYIWEFDEAFTAFIPASNISGASQFFRLSVAGFDDDNAAANIRYKTTGTSATTAAAVKLTVAGSSVAAIPEPSSALLCLVGSLALLRRRRR